MMTTKKKDKEKKKKEKNPQLEGLESRILNLTEIWSFFKILLKDVNQDLNFKCECLLAN